MFCLLSSVSPELRALLSQQVISPALALGLQGPWPWPANNVFLNDIAILCLGTTRVHCSLRIVVDVGLAFGVGRAFAVGCEGGSAHLATTRS